MQINVFEVYYIYISRPTSLGIVLNVAIITPAPPPPSASHHPAPITVIQELVSALFMQLLLSEFHTSVALCI